MSYELARGLGADESGAYRQWVDQVKALGGAPTVWPDSRPLGGQSYYGMFAARFDNPTFVQRYNNGQIDPRAPETISANGQFVYVLAPASVQSSGPRVMTTYERLENAVFTNLDSAADAIGLPSLDSIEGFLLSGGKWLLLAVALGAGVWLLAPSIRSHLTAP